MNLISSLLAFAAVCVAVNGDQLVRGVAQAGEAMFDWRRQKND
jgi:hypothetical protein